MISTAPCLRCGELVSVDHEVEAGVAVCDVSLRESAARRPNVAYHASNSPRLLDSTYKGLTRIAQIVERLHGFARIHHAEIGEFDVNESIEQSIQVPDERPDPEALA